MHQSRSLLRKLMMAVMSLALVAGPVAAPAQIQPVDPDKAIDGDLSRPTGTPEPAPTATSASLPAEAAPPSAGDAVTTAGSPGWRSACLAPPWSLVSQRAGSVRRRTHRADRGG